MLSFVEFFGVVSWELSYCNVLVCFRLKMMVGFLVFVIFLIDLKGLLLFMSVRLGWLLMVYVINGWLSFLVSLKIVTKVFVFVFVVIVGMGIVMIEFLL